MIYVRVSSEEQAKGDFSSIEAQLAGCRRRAKDEGWEIVREFRDDVTAKDLEREGMQRLISAVKHERIDIVLASRMDRVSRDTVDTEVLMRMCKQQGTEFVFLQQTLDEKSASGRMNRRMGSVFNQYEREIISDRVRFKIGELARVGRRAGGWTPPGYVWVKHHEYVLDERYAPMIRLIFDQAAAGRRIADITAYLKSEGYVVPVRMIQRRTGPAKIGGRPFKWDQVKEILRNPIYRATLIVDGAEHPSTLPRVVADDLWFKANAAIKKSGPAVYKSRQNKHELLLHGLLLCGCCKAPMVGHPARGRNGTIYLYYRCQNLRKNGRGTGCSVGQVPARRLEEAVIGQVGVFAQDPKVLEAAIEEATNGRRRNIAPLKAEMKTIEERIFGLRSGEKELRSRFCGVPAGSPFIQEIVADADKIVLERRELEAQLHQLRERKAAIEQEFGDGKEIRAELSRFSDVFGALDSAKKRQALRLLIRKIEVKHSNELTTILPTRRSESALLRQKRHFSVTLDLYAKSQFSRRARGISTT